MNKPTLIERAYQLARSGECEGLTDVRKRLRTEGYAANDLIGKGLLDDLARCCRVAAGRPAVRTPPPQPISAEERAERSRRAAETRRRNRPPLAAKALLTSGEDV